MKGLILIILCCIFLAKGSFGATNVFWVTNTLDNSSGSPYDSSLRWAIESANAHPGDDNYVKFAIPGTGMHTINLIGNWIDITAKVIIDGTTQDPSRDYIKQDPLIMVQAVGTPYYFGTIFNLLYDAGNSYDASGTQIKAISISGEGIGGSVEGIYIYGPPSASATAIENIVIENCYFNSLTDAIFLESCSHVKIRGCYFGIDHTLKLNSINNMVGIAIWASRQNGNVPKITEIKIGGEGTDANIFEPVNDGSPISLAEWNLNGPDLHHVLITQNLFLQQLVNRAIALSGSPYAGTYPANDDIQPPVITEVNSTAKTISGTAGHNYKIEVFASYYPQEAHKYLGYVMSDNSGNWSMSGLPLPSSDNQFIATATDSVNNTSEFSNVGVTNKPVINDIFSCDSFAHTLSVSPYYASYQWYKNGSLLAGETNYDYVATLSGNYYVIVTIAGLGGSFTSYSYEVY